MKSLWQKPQNEPKKFSKNSKFAILILKILEFPTGGNSIFSDLQPHRHGGNGKTNPSSCHLHWTFSYPAEYLWRKIIDGRIGGLGGFRYPLSPFFCKTPLKAKCKTWPRNSGSKTPCKTPWRAIGPPWCFENFIKIWVRGTKIRRKICLMSFPKKH